MERVKKDEPYYFITFPSLVIERGWDNYRLAANLDFESGNYFYTKEEAETMARKLRAVLAGADVIEMPSEEEIKIYSLLNHLSEKECQSIYETISWLKTDKIVK